LSRRTELAARAKLIDKAKDSKAAGDVKRCALRNRAPSKESSLRIETLSRRAKEIDAPRHAWFDTYDFYGRKRDSHFGIPEVMAHINARSVRET